MFEISKLKRQIERIRRSYVEQHEELKKKNAPQDQLDQLEAADFARPGKRTRNRLDLKYPSFP